MHQKVVVLPVLAGGIGWKKYPKEKREASIFYTLPQKLKIVEEKDTVVHRSHTVRIYPHYGKKLWASTAVIYLPFLDNYPTFY